MKTTLTCFDIKSTSNRNANGLRILLLGVKSVGKIGVGFTIETDFLEQKIRFGEKSLLFLLLLLLLLLLYQNPVLARCMSRFISSVHLREESEKCTNTLLP